MNRGAFLAGAFFTIIGLFFLLDRLEVLDLSTTFVWPVMLIVLGLLVLLGARARTQGPPAP